ncbi:MAG: DUF6197 family protein [Mycobacterium sp.]
MTATLDIDDIKADTEDEVEQQLRVALRYLETFGWRQGDYGYDNPDDFGCRACALGSMNAACDLLYGSDGKSYTYRRGSTQAALSDVVGKQVAQWNDEDDRTLDEVTAAFTEAIANRQAART